MLRERRESHSFLRSFRTLDLYPRIQHEVTHATWFGFLASLIGMAMTAYLICGHVSDFLTRDVRTDFFVLGTNRSREWKTRGVHSESTDMYVTFNVTFNKMPCNFLTVDYYDVFGVRDLDAANNIELNTLNVEEGHSSVTQSTLTSGTNVATGRRLMAIEDTNDGDAEGSKVDDPFDVMPDGSASLNIKDLEVLAEQQGNKKSDVHPSAVVIKVGEEERHIVPGVGEIQVIDESHPIHDAEHGKATELGPDDFRDFVHEHDTVLVNFFVPWCHWCRQLGPIWDAASNTVSASEGSWATSTKLAKVNCDTHQSFCQNHQIRAFPTMKVYRKGSTMTHKQYNGQRTVRDIVNYVKALPSEPDEITQLGPEAVDREATEHCVAWRQTKNCDPNGPREPENDKGCSQNIQNRNSGYCECKDKVHAAPVTCEHERVSFTCADMCKKKLDELAGHNDPKKAKEDAQFDAYMRTAGKNSINVDGLHAHIQRAGFAKTFKAAHIRDVATHEPELKENMELGCNAHGKFKVGFTPGSLVFTAYSPWHNFNKENVDMAHVVHDLAFVPAKTLGRISQRKGIRETLSEHGIHLNALAGKSFEAKDGHKYAHEHYLRLMQTSLDTDLLHVILSEAQTTYRGLQRWVNKLKVGLPFRRFFQTFQYSAQSHNYPIDVEHEELPSVRVIWDMDPIGVEIYVVETSLYTLITSLLAVIGGVFTVLAIADGTVHAITKRLCGSRNGRSNGKGHYT